MKIFIDRDSVCMGDDVEDHRLTIEVDEIYTTFVDEIPLVKEWADRSHEKILFKYYSNREKRAKSIFINSGGDSFHIWHEGLLSEYKSYNVTNEMEKKWKVGF